MSFDEFDPAILEGGDLIPYGAIGRGDFRAEHPPAERAAHRDKLSAYTCARIHTEAGGKVWVERRPVPSGRPGEVVYVATLEGARVSARMDRGCSWWNPKDTGLPPDYILQHEQIHFALIELAARRINAELAKLMARLRATAATEEEAQARVEREFEAIVRRGSEAMLARSYTFDEDTSMGHKPQAQARWWAAVQAELAASSGSTTAGVR